jgi:hypothetical protein
MQIQLFYMIIIIMLWGQLIKFQKFEGLTIAGQLACLYRG